MATAEDGAHVSPDSEVTERLLGRLAHRFYPQHLHRFATLQLGIRDAKFYHIQEDAGPDSWRRAFFVRVCSFLT